MKRSEELSATMLDALARIMKDDIIALQEIANGEPDSKLSNKLNEAMPNLKKRGWIRVCGCSDGDYVQVTALGQSVLDKLP